MTNVQPLRPLGGPASWHGRDLVEDGAWLRQWSGKCLDAFDCAIRSAEKRGLAWHQVSRKTFALDCIADELSELADYLENGRGLVRISGFPVEQYTATQCKMLFYGLGSWLGRPITQSSRGELIGEICDEGPQVGAKRGQMLDEHGQAFRSSRARAQSPALLRWHTDRTDVVGLLCAGKPARGGTSRVASAIAVHDEMVRQRPDLAALLYQDLERSNLGEEAGGENHTYAIPVWGVRDGKFATHYSRTFVEAAQKLPGVTPLSPEYWEALDFLAAIAEQICVEMDFELGDMQFINNHIVYHARDDYEDDPTSGQRRLLYRVWLCMENSRPLPESYEVLFGSTAAGAMRGGIAVAPGAVANG